MLTLFSVNFLSMVFFFLYLRSRFSKQRLTGELRSEVDKLIIDLGREADRDVALLESRIQNLRSLMDEADRRILLAGKEDIKRHDIVHFPGPLQQTIPQEVVKEPVKPEREPITVYTRPSIQRSENRIEPFIPMHERVLDMARKGISSEMIASTMSVSLGEIELILDMNSSSL